VSRDERRGDERRATHGFQRKEQLARQKDGGRAGAPSRLLVQVHVAVAVKVHDYDDDDDYGLH
jgi:hypothetical protein